MKRTPPVIDFPLAPPGTMGPPAEYVRLRAQCPVAKVDIDPEATAWYVTRYADVRSLIADPRLIRPTINDWPDRSDLDDQDPGLTTMMELEGPEHTALRRVLTDAFSVRTVGGATCRICARSPTACWTPSPQAGHPVTWSPSSPSPSRCS